MVTEIVDSAQELARHERSGTNVEGAAQNSNNSSGLSIPKVHAPVLRPASPRPRKRGSAEIKRTDARLSWFCFLSRLNGQTALCSRGGSLEASVERAR